MLNETQARAIALKKMPEGSKIIHVVDYSSYYILLIHWPDPLEGQLDPFFSVNKETGIFSDFDLSDGGPELISQFL